MKITLFSKVTPINSKHLTHIYCETKHLEIVVKNCFHEKGKTIHEGNQYRVTIGSGLAGLQWSPPTKSKPGKKGPRNSKPLKVRMSHMSAFPIISVNVVGLLAPQIK